MSATPEQVEERLIELGREYDEAFFKMRDSEFEFVEAEHTYKMASIKARLSISQRYADKGVKLTVQEKDDLSFMETHVEHKAHALAEATLRVARANLKRIGTHVDIARSVGVSQRKSMEIV